MTTPSPLASSLPQKALRRLARYATRFASAAADRLIDRAADRVGHPRARDIPTHMTAAELNCLHTLVLGLGAAPRVLEIGSFLGASSRLLAAALPVAGRLYCVDTWNNETMPGGLRDTLAEFRANVAPFSDRITPVRKNSRDIRGEDFDLPLDMVFIDGDHSYAGVRHDHHATAPWLVDGGIMAFHDATYFQGVSRVIGEALATGQWQIAGNVDSLLLLRKATGERHGFPNP
jgi:predicted O-methyltransferase YrrM